ncbi:MAG: DNA-protecting protein DprA [Candidatus Kapabacteria bacterium]|nr:DNA-protecting protein DprA [Candidatus Kapabacteria bacterium]
MTHWPITDLVALTLLQGLTAADIRMLATTTDSLEGALQLRAADATLFGTPCQALREIAEGAIRRAAAMHVQVLPWYDTRIPQRMRDAVDPPAVLWVRGPLPDTSTTCIGVVGTRTCTVSYGAPVTKAFVERWVDAGCAIVSGLAGGIDTVAHETTLAARGVTVAVIASGIDRVGPLRARRLADAIVDHGGAIVSEYRCGQAALPPFFPQRNRIISALSDAIVVVESGRTGGSLITAEFARRHRRPLYAVPGPVTSSRSQGTNTLLRNGHARALCTADELLDDLGVTRLPLGSTLPLTDPERRVMHAMEGGDASVDVIAERCNASTAAMWTMLLEMELRGLVRQLPGGRFAICTPL